MANPRMVLTDSSVMSCSAIGSLPPSRASAPRAGHGVFSRVDSTTPRPAQLFVPQARFSNLLATAMKSLRTRADNACMAPVELTVEQCRTLERIRRNRPAWEVRLHGTRHGVVVEVREGHRTELVRLGAAGQLERD